MIGAHINREYVKAGSPIIMHLRKAKELYNISTFSIFVSAPKAKRIIVKDSEFADLREFCKSNTIIAHTSHVSHPWTGDEACIEHIINELRTCEACGIAGLVVHLPKSGLASVEKYITRFVFTRAIRLYFETPAVIDSDFDTPAKLDKLLALIKRIDPELLYFGICIDTAHLHTNGINLHTRAHASEYLDALTIPKNILMFHLNDSERALHTGPDSHMPLMHGRIWEGLALAESGLYPIINFIKKHNVPAILERDDSKTILNDIDLYKGV